MKNKILIVTLILFAVIKSYSQKEHYYCLNFFKETLNNCNNPDTLIIIDNSIGLLEKQSPTASDCRNIVYIFKQNGNWYSAYCFIRYEKDEMAWYQTLKRKFYDNSKKSLELLFDNCFNDIQKLIENKNTGRNSGRFVFLYVQKGGKSHEIIYCTPTTGDIMGLINTEYKSFYDAYSLGLAHSITMYFPYQNKCRQLRSLKKDSIQTILEKGKVMD